MASITENITGCIPVEIKIKLFCIEKTENPVIHFRPHLYIMATSMINYTQNILLYTSKIMRTVQSSIPNLRKTFIMRSFQTFPIAKGDFCCQEHTKVELAVHFFTVDNIETVATVCIHVADFKVEPLVMVISVDIRVQYKIILICSNLQMQEPTQVRTAQ